MRSQKDGEIDWRMSAQSIGNLIKGLAKPYPGAHFEWKTRTIKVWKAEVVENNCINLEPGKILAVDKYGVLVKAGVDAVRLIETDPLPIIGIGDYL